MDNKTESTVDFFCNVLVIPVRARLKAGHQAVGMERDGCCIQDGSSVLSNGLYITVRAFSWELGYLFIPSDRGGCYVCVSAVNLKELILLDFTREAIPGW